MLYFIYHPKNGVMNHDCKEAQYEYELIAEVEAKDLSQAFMLGQNDFNKGYEYLGHRSTSVGDIIKDESNICWLVEGTRFKEVSNYWLRYIDWGNHLSADVLLQYAQFK